MATLSISDRVLNALKRTSYEAFQADSFSVPLEAVDTTKEGIVHFASPILDVSADRRLHVLIRPGKWLLVAFYRKTLSNFVRMAEGQCSIPVDAAGAQEKVFFSCPEALFKTACLLLHQDLHGAETVPDETVLKAVNAGSPIDVKRSTSKIANFQGEKWDAISGQVMAYAQAARLQEKGLFLFMKALEALAKGHQVPLADVHFAEAAGENDLIWGAGATVGEMVSDLTTLPAVDNVRDDYLSALSGQNKLGVAIGEAFQAATLFDSLDAYCDHFQNKHRRLFVGRAAQ